MLFHLKKIESNPHTWLTTDPIKEPWTLQHRLSITGRVSKARITTKILLKRPHQFMKSQREIQEMLNSSVWVNLMKRIQLNRTGLSWMLNQECNRTSPSRLQLMRSWRKLQEGNPKELNSNQFKKSIQLFMTIICQKVQLLSQTRNLQKISKTLPKCPEQWRITKKLQQIGSNRIMNLLKPYKTKKVKSKGESLILEMTKGLKKSKKDSRIKRSNSKRRKDQWKQDMNQVTKKEHNFL